MTRWNVNGSPVYRGSDANSVGHEMGHNMGLDDPGGDYYAPGGAMDYDGPYDPTVNDVSRMIEYSYRNNGTDPIGSNPKTSFEVLTDEK